MIKLDCYYGVDSDEMWGINKYKLETYAKISDNDVDKKKITYSVPQKPDIIKRIANFFDLFLFSPLAVVKHSRKDSVVFIMSHSEAYLLNYFKFRKSVVLCYDILPLLFRLSGWMSRVKLKFAFKGMLKADRIIAVSEGVKDDIVNHLGYPAERIDVVYGGVNPEHYKVMKEDLSLVKRKYGIPEDKGVVLFLASEEPRKNFPLVIKSFAKLKKRMPDIVLLKVGKARKKGVREKNIKLIKQLGIGRDVIFSGYVPEEDIPAIYNAVDLLVYPAFYEGGLCLPFLEAMACGCPVISNRFFSESIGDSPAIMQNATDVDELESLMHKVLTDKSFRLKVVNHGLEQSKKFHWEKTGKSIVDICKRLATE